VVKGRSGKGAVVESHRGKDDAVVKEHSGEQGGVVKREQKKSTRW